jgi:hypothetical protein
MIRPQQPADFLQQKKEQSSSANGNSEWGYIQHLGPKIGYNRAAFNSPQINFSYSFGNALLLSSSQKILYLD